MSIVRIDSLPFAAPEGIKPIEGVSSATQTSEAGGVGGPSFESLLGDAIHQANQTDYVASQKSTALAAGKIDDIHGTMIAVKEADISMKLVGTVRNKILDAFQELWKTSV